MVNIKPNNDEREHVSDVHCWCEPRVEYRNDDTDAEYKNGPLIIHNAADGRETVEKMIGESLAPEKGWTVWKRL